MGCLLFTCAPIAQLAEHLICNQEVGSSSLSGGTKLKEHRSHLPASANQSANRFGEKRNLKPERLTSLPEDMPFKQGMILLEG